MPTERLLVLASSKKFSARCIAGISLNTGRWLRPVSTSQGGALTTVDCGIEGRYPRLREVVRFETIEICPLPHQPENVLVPAEPWTLETQLSYEDTSKVADEHLEPGPDLLRGTTRTLDEEAVRARPVRTSLALVEPEDLRFWRERVDWGNGSRVWARFRLGAHHHRLTLSDFAIRPRLEKLDPGTYTLEQLGLAPPPRSLVTVSLSDAHDGRHYKLAAAVVGVGAARRGQR